MENFVTKELLIRKKVEEKDPSDLLPKVAAEKMTRRLLRGCQLEVF